MEKKTVSGIMLTLLLVSAINFAAISFVARADGSEGGSVDWWLMFRHDENHTGYSTELAPTESDTTRKWNFTTNGAVYSSSAVANDTVFVGSNDSNLYAFDLNGVKKWNVSLGGPVYSSPAVDGDIVFVGSLNGSVYAINATNGSIKWNCPTKDSVYSSPVIAGGVVFVGSDDYNVYALNETNGKVIWSFPTGAPVRSSPAIANDRIFFGVEDGRVYALNATTFRYLWHFETGGSVSSSPAIEDGMVFVGSLNGTIYALKETNGDKVWRFPTDEDEYIGPVHSSPAVAYGKVFIGSNDTEIYALDELDGTLIWSFPTGGAVCSSPAVANSTIFVGSSDFQVYALNETDGKVRWNYTTGDAVWSSPAIAAKKVFVGSLDKEVYAFEEPNIKPVPVINYYPENSIICQTVTFDGSDSYDPDGNITDWYWQFGDGTTANSKIVTHAYEAAGPYTVTLTVTDNGLPKATNSTSQLITVLEAWPMFLHNPKHWGNSTSLAPVTNVTIWEPKIGSDMSSDPWMYPSPVVVGGEIYIGSTNGTKGIVSAFCANHTLKWSKEIDGRIFSSPAVVDGLVFIGSEDYYVYAWNATNGDPAWNRTTGGPVYSSPVVVDGKVFVGSQDGKIYAFKTDGYPLWNQTTGGSIHSSPAVAYGKVFVGSADGVYAWYTNGTPVSTWPFKTGEKFDSSPAVAYGRVFVASDDGYVYALDVTNGSNVKWNYKIGSRIKSSPAVANGMVFIGSDDGNLYALNAMTSNRDGEKIWSKTIGSVGWSSPAVAEDKVFIGTIEGKIYALRQKDGEISWSYQTGGRVDSSPAVFSDTLYAASKDGKLYAFWEQVHDIAVATVSSQPRVAQNQTLDITVSVENQGSFNETDINVTAQYDDNLFNSTSINLTRGEERLLIIPWNTTSVPEGNYTIYVNATLAPPITDNDTADNTKYVNITVEIGVHDINVTDVKPSSARATDPIILKDIVGQGYTVTIYVTVKNEGNYTEKNINVTAYWSNSTHTNQTIGSIIIPELLIKTSVTVSITWSTSGIAKGNYTVSAVADTVPGETDTGDNTFVNGAVKVAIAGDINGDGHVNILDAILLGNAFDSAPGDSTWGPNADINGDGYVNILDAIMLGNHFDEKEP